MSANHTTITVRGDKQFVQRVKKFAALNDKRIGDIVRESIDKTYGEEIASFFAQLERQIEQHSTERHTS
jgi:hypothetical protein